MFPSRNQSQNQRQNQSSSQAQDGDRMLRPYPQLQNTSQNLSTAQGPIFAHDRNCPHLFPNPLSQQQLENQLSTPFLSGPMPHPNFLPFFDTRGNPQASISPENHGNIPFQGNARSFINPELRADGEINYRNMAKRPRDLDNTLHGAHNNQFHQPLPMGQLSSRGLNGETVQCPPFFPGFGFANFGAPEAQNRFPPAGAFPEIHPFNPSQNFGPSNPYNGGMGFNGTFFGRKMGFHPYPYWFQTREIAGFGGLEENQNREMISNENEPQVRSSRCQKHQKQKENIREEENANGGTRKRYIIDE